MEEEFQDVAKFFKADEWNQMGSYEKRRYQTMFNNYKDMIGSGCNVPKPDFMNNEAEDKRKTNAVSDKKKKFKRKRVVKSATRKRTKLRKAAANRRYPKRNIPAKNYEEPDEISTDRYVYCDECMHEYLDSCQKHELVHVYDNVVPPNKNNVNRARDTVPRGWVEVKQSKIKDAGDGIWAVRQIPKGIRFGPYEGNSNEEKSDGHYSWQIRNNGKVIGHVDGYDTAVSNWMRYVNCARNKCEQNLMAYQYRGEIYYRSVVDIESHTELLVFYGSKFAKELGIDVKHYNSPRSNPLPERVFKCENCSVVFSNPINLDDHIARCSKKYVATEDNNDCVLSDGRYECKPCFVLLKNLKLKQPVYTNPDSGLDSASSMSSVHPSTSEVALTVKKTCTNARSRRFKCTVCTKTFTRIGHLKSHELVHTGEKTCECDVCHKRFTQLGNLQRHKRMHSGEKPFDCNLCNKRFRKLYNLQRHKRMHSGEKPYSCNLCRQRFSQLNNLQRHQRIHSGEKPYSCKLCRQQFSQLNNLQRHQRIH